MLVTKLSHEVVAQTSNVRFEPTAGGTATTEAEIRLRAAPGRLGPLREGALPLRAGMSWNAWRRWARRSNAG